jgi:chromosome segregation ATPase
MWSAFDEFKQDFRSHDQRLHDLSKSLVRIEVEKKELSNKLDTIHEEISCYRKDLQEKISQIKSRQSKMLYVFIFLGGVLFNTDSMVFSFLNKIIGL